MGKYIIKGGYALKGEIDANGSKNAILPILAATILNEKESILHNCPHISDLIVTEKILKNIGCSVKRKGKTLIIHSANAQGNLLDNTMVQKMRSSILFLGSILSRFGEAQIGYPGGCAIGERPIDLHIQAMKKMGVEIKEKDGILHCKAKRLKGTKINFVFPSVGATENIMLLAVKAKGQTTIYNAAKEPEIIDLQNYLKKAGAKIRGAGTDTIIIEGVEELNCVEYNIMPDRIEAGTFLCAAAITKGELLLKNVNPDDMRQILLQLLETGCMIKEYKNEIFLKAPNRLHAIHKIYTQPYPGFPTDMQPQFMSLLTLAKGTSIIIETVFESRFKHIVDLCQMGADIDYEGRIAIIKGVSKIKGACLASKDLRGGAALITAGLAAEGETIICRSEYVERGYESIEKSFTKLGAKIELVENIKTGR